MQIGHNGGCDVLWKALHPIKQLRYYFDEDEKLIFAEGYCIWSEWDDTGVYLTRIQACGHMCLCRYSLCCCMCEIREDGRQILCLICLRRGKLAGEKE